MCLKGSRRKTLIADEIRNRCRDRWVDHLLLPSLSLTGLPNWNKKPSFGLIWVCWLARRANLFASFLCFGLLRQFCVIPLVPDGNLKNVWHRARRRARWAPARWLYSVCDSVSLTPGVINKLRTWAKGIFSTSLIVHPLKKNIVDVLFVRALFLIELANLVIIIPPLRLPLPLEVSFGASLY